MMFEHSLLLFAFDFIFLCFICTLELVKQVFTTDDDLIIRIDVELLFQSIVERIEAVVDYLETYGWHLDYGAIASIFRAFMVISLLICSPRSSSEKV